MSNSLLPQGLQLTRLLCPSLYILEFGQIMSIELLMLSNHLILCANPPTPSPFAFSLPQHQSWFSESALCIRWPKYYSFSISPSNEYSGLISFRINWLDLLAVQGTLRSLLQHHNLKALIL